MIRAATESDLPTLIRLGARFWKQTTYYTLYSVPYCPDSVAATCREMMREGLIFVDDSLRGVIGIVAVPIYANRSYTTYSELFWYVEAEARLSGVGSELIARAEEVAKDRGGKFIAMMSLEAVEPDQADRFYRKSGYRLAEHTYVKVI